MKKLALILISSMAMLSTGTLLAQDADAEPGMQRHHKQHKQRGMQRMPMAEQVFRTFRRLDLDDTQKENVRGIFETMRADLKPVMKDMKAAQLQLRELITAGDFDADAVAAIAQREGELTTERILITSRAMSDAYAQLTEEQRAELAAMAEERRAKRNQKRGKAGQQGGQDTTES